MWRWKILTLFKKKQRYFDVILLNFMHIVLSFFEFLHICKLLNFPNHLEVFSKLYSSNCRYYLMLLDDRTILTWRLSTSLTYLILTIFLIVLARGFNLQGICLPPQFMNQPRWVTCPRLLAWKHHRRLQFLILHLW